MSAVSLTADTLEDTVPREGITLVDWWASWCGPCWMFAPRRSRGCAPPSPPHGFGVLTEIDVTATLQAKLGEQMEDYVILGACNPPFAYQALGIDRSIGMLLPCNVVVRATADGSIVEALDPQVMVTLTGRPELQPVADEVAGRLAAALAGLTLEDGQR